MATRAKTAKEPEAVTINMQPFLTPAALVLGAIIIGVSNLFGFYALAGRLGSANLVGSGSSSSTSSAAGIAVSRDQIKALFTTSGNMVLGNPNAKNLFVEFSDPSCPYCHIASGKNPELNKEVGTQFTLVESGGSYVAPVPEIKKLVESGDAAYLWMYSNGHGNGELATQALYCANEKGKFWEAHDKMMTMAGYNLINDVVKNDVANAGKMADFISEFVDKNFVVDCLQSKKYADRIASDQQVGRDLGVQGTPGFFVNDTNFPGAFSFTDMAAAID